MTEQSMADERGIKLLSIQSLRAIRLRLDPLQTCATISALPDPLNRTNRTFQCVSVSAYWGLTAIAFLIE